VSILATSISSIELLVKKSGLGGCEMAERREGRRGSSTSSLSSDGQYFYCRCPNTAKYFGEMFSSLT